MTDAEKFRAAMEAPDCCNTNPASVEVTFEPCYVLSPAELNHMVNTFIAIDRKKRTQPERDEAAAEARGYRKCLDDYRSDSLILVGLGAVLGALVVSGVWFLRGW